MERRDLESIARQALCNANERIVQLGIDGIKEVQKNQFGDIALQGDIEAEKVVLETFRRHKVPIRFISEEHGTTDITSNPQLLAVMDGIDGSYCYKRHFNGETPDQYGTMLGIFEGINPKYRDFIFSGMMMHNRPRLYYTDEGVSMLLNGGSGRPMMLGIPRHKILGQRTNILIDLHWAPVIERFYPALKEFGAQTMKSSAAHMTSFLDRGGVIIECTSKRNLELAAGYGLLHGVGAAILSETGEELTDKNYLNFGQEEHIPIVIASTHKLANEVLRKVRE